MSRPNASFARTLVVGIASAGLALVACNAVWAVQEGSAPARPDELSGADVAPLVVPLTLVALACWGAVLVLRRRGRRVVAVLGAAAATAAAVATVVRVAGAEDLDLTAWPWVVAAAAAVTALALARAWLAAPGWPEMSSRYDRRAADDRAAAGAAAAGADAGADGGAAEGPAGEPRPDRPQGPADLWRALDEGRDPTA